MALWMGVDVGGKRKGFDAALVDDSRLLRLEGGLSCDAVIELVRTCRPALVGIDSPRRCAPDGHGSRTGERQLARSICGIRWTPERSRVELDPYYAWVREGLALFDALSELEADAIEVFPTASWTRWQGTRGRRKRAAWSRRGLDELGLEGLPRRTNQDQRDAIAAAVTARLHSRGATETIGEIVVPRVSRVRSSS